MSTFAVHSQGAWQQVVTHLGNRGYDFSTDW